MKKSQALSEGLRRDLAKKIHLALVSTPLESRRILESVLAALAPPLFLTRAQLERLRDLEKRQMTQRGDKNALLALVRRGLATEHGEITNLGRTLLREQRSKAA